MRILQTKYCLLFFPIYNFTIWIHEWKNRRTSLRIMTNHEEIILSNSMQIYLKTPFNYKIVAVFLLFNLFFNLHDVIKPFAKLEYWWVCTCKDFGFSEIEFLRELVHFMLGFFEKDGLFVIDDWVKLLLGFNNNKLLI